MYFNTTATDGSSSWAGFIHATKAYLAGNYSLRAVNASLDATPETAYAFLNQSLQEFTRNVDT
jgi:hypothetical protein